MAPTRLWTERLSYVLRMTTARLLMLCLYATVLCLVLGYLLGWFMLVQALMNNQALKFDGLDWDGLRRVMRVAVATGILVCSAVLPLSAVLRAIHAEPHKNPKDEVRLEKSDAPELWSMFEELDRRLGTRTGETFISLTSHPNASVFASPPGKKPSWKKLRLGVPLLAGVGPEELRALLCHELGHCVGQYHRFDAVASRGARRLQSLEEGLRISMLITTESSVRDALLRFNVRVLIVPLHAYRVLYERITRSARHRQEYEADRIAARHVGADVVGRALKQADKVQTEWEALRPTIKPPRSQRQLIELYQSLGDTPPTRANRQSHRRKEGNRSSHPPVSRRLAVLGLEQGGDLPPPGASGLRLLTSPVEGAGTRWPRLPYPMIKGGTRVERSHDWHVPVSVPLGTLVKFLVGILTTISLVSHAVEYFSG
ncbi:M48 family metalloprotease [Streptomyces sp. NPDC052095]|uniref:M48 family metallopeptidase n=1 Tax=unclassified Streptomyces TaxID=2593676 RepID=UPI00344EAD57